MVGRQPKGHVGQPAGHGVARRTLTATASAPALAAVIGVENTTGQNYTVGFEVLADDFESEVIESAELGQVGAREGSVRQVEVFWMGGVGTSIFRGPRRLPRQHPVNGRHTLNCEEPEICSVI